MYALSASELLLVWEADRERPRAAEWASWLLLQMRPEGDRTVPETLTVGQRDVRLLRLRQRSFGDVMPAQTRCPRCREKLEFSVSAAKLLAASADEPGAGAAWNDHDAGEWHLRFRSPTALDLTEIGATADLAGLRARLLSRCITDVFHGASRDDVGSLPDDVIAAVVARMEELDPCADINLALNCPACGHEWQSNFDIVGYLRTEIAFHARQVAREIDALARAYGWSERDILSLSSRRRRMYLEMCEA